MVEDSQFQNFIACTQCDMTSCFGVLAPMVELFAKTAWHGYSHGTRFWYLNWLLIISWSVCWSLLYEFVNLVHEGHGDTDPPSQVPTLSTRSTFLCASTVTVMLHKFQIQCLDRPWFLIRDCLNDKCHDQPLIFDSILWQRYNQDWYTSALANNTQWQTVRVHHVWFHN